MKIKATSDLHGYLPEIKEKCDIFLICGDILPLNIQTNKPESKRWLKEEFKNWIQEIPCEKVLFIAGNHDFIMESNLTFMKNEFPRYYKATYLQDEMFEYVSEDGQILKVFGAPWCKIYGHWAFMREPESLIRHFSKIPENLDILMTHDAPYGVSDICEEDTPWNTHEHIGNPQLADEIKLKSPRINLHGHLHSTSHSKEYLGNTEVYNVSYVNEQYKPAWEPLEFNI